jgi:hypothetical protein
MRISSPMQTTTLYTVVATVSVQSDEKVVEPKEEKGGPLYVIFVENGIISTRTKRDSDIHFPAEITWVPSNPISVLMDNSKLK